MMKFLAIKLECEKCGSIKANKIPCDNIEKLKVNLPLVYRKCTCGNKKIGKILDAKLIEVEV